MSTDVNSAVLEAVNETEIVVGWLNRFAEALEAEDYEKVLSSFTSDFWWRDLSTATWDLTTSHNAEDLKRILGDAIFEAAYSDWQIEDGKSPTSANGIIDSFISFRTKVAIGRGMVKLQQEGGEWKAWILLTRLDGIVGHPEKVTSVWDAQKENYNAPVDERMTWVEKRRHESEFVDGDPEVVVIGGGHSGLQIAARLKHLDVSTLVVEKNDRLGDNWRNRYNNLALHDTKWYGEWAYLPYPDNWPVFAPKELVADWHDAYGWMMQLNVWTNTEAIGASFDRATGEWTVRVNREGAERVLHPKHVVFASGAFAGHPHAPELPGRDEFAGEVLHSSEHVGGPRLKGKKVVVVGSGSSGHDVSQDAYENGADVTMVQRGPSYVVSSRFGVPAMHADLYSEFSPSTDDADLISQSYPWFVFLASAPAVVDNLNEMDKEMLEGLNKAGFETYDGPDREGLFGISLRLSSGYYIDKGCSQLIIDRKVKIKRGSVSGLTESGVEFEDGSTQNADIVVFATGWPNMRENIRPIVGDSVADQVSPVWGLDEQGEIQGAFRPSGHPNLWFQAGGFQQARYGSKLLGLQIKGALLGINDQPRPVSAS